MSWWETLHLVTWWKRLGISAIKTGQDAPSWIWCTERLSFFGGGHIVLQRFVHVRCHFQPLPTKLVFAYFDRGSYIIIGKGNIPTHITKIPVVSFRGEWPKTTKTPHNRFNSTQIYVQLCSYSYFFPRVTESFLFVPNQLDHQRVMVGQAFSYSIGNFQWASLINHSHISWIVATTYSKQKSISKQKSFKS